MPVLPLVGSINTVLPGWMRPAFSASSIMLTPMRSFTLAQGLNPSSLAAILALLPSDTLCRYTSGVWPMSSVTLFAIFMNCSLLNDAERPGCASDFFWETRGGKRLERRAAESTTTGKGVKRGAHGTYCSKRHPQLQASVFNATASQPPQSGAYPLNYRERCELRPVTAR